MPTEKLSYQDSLKAGTDKLNKVIDQSNQSEIDSKEALSRSGQRRNKGTPYPLINLNMDDIIDVNHKNFILNGLLDIKIFNAERDKQYRLRYVTKNNTTYGDLILIDVFDSTNTKVRDLFNVVRKDYPINDTGISTLVLNADNGNEIVLITIDYSVLTSNTIIDFSNTIFKDDMNRISPECLFIDLAPFKDIERYRGREYPLVFKSGTITTSGDYNRLKNGLLDIKIFNAEIGYDYDFNYITKNQTTYGDLVLINAIKRSDGTIRALFTTAKKTYDITNRNGISTVVIPADNGNEIVEFTFDYRLISDGFIPATTANAPFKSNYISRDFYHYQKPSKGDVDSYNSVVEFVSAENRASIYGKYGSIQDLKISFKKFSVNQLFALHGIYRKAASAINPAKFSGGTTISAADTDWIGPYIMRAVNNGDGSSKQYTGGAHSSDNNATTGNPTAVTESYEVYVDGAKLSADGDYTGNVVDIYVRNKIMAYNTRTVGRYVLMELVHYKIIGSVIHVNVDIIPLEDIVIEEYYGQQAVSLYYESVLYPQGQHAAGQLTNTANDSGPKLSYFVDTFILSKGTEKLIVEHDNTKNLGRRRFVPLDAPCAFNRSYAKAYMQLAFNNTTVSPANDLLQWSGKYTFKP